MNCSIHVDETYKKLSSAIYSIRRTKGLFTFQCAKLTYTNFYSIETYGILLRGSSSSVKKIIHVAKESLDNPVPPEIY